jgi:hypothetical protein
MSLLTEMERMICDHNISYYKAQHMCLAYLMLHREEPGLHPDDAMYRDSGYAGWQAVLVNAVLSLDEEIPDKFHYPNCFNSMTLDPMLEELLLKEDDLGCIAMINTIKFWLKEMKPSEVDGIVDCFQMSTTL